MNKNLKATIIILVLIIIILAAVYYFRKSIFKKQGDNNSTGDNFVKGYAKSPGQWVACSVKDYDNQYYSGINSAGATIYFKKAEVTTRPGTGASAGDKCADASANMNVYTIKQG